jgi:hypothetical protein
MLTGCSNSIANPFFCAKISALTLHGYRHIAPTGLPTYRPYRATDISPLQGYRHIAPTGLPTYRPDGATNMSPLQGYRHIAPMGLPICRPDGATNMSPRWGYRHFAPTGLPTFRAYGAISYFVPITIGTENLLSTSYFVPITIRFVFPILVAFRCKSVFHRIYR